MRKITTLLSLCFLFCTATYAQQDAMFTKYMFNSLTYNPGYAGAKDHLAIGLLHRTQWWGIDGAPQTQSFTIHTPLKNERVGLGLNAVNDKIGPTNSISANISYAYRIPLGKGKLSVGIQGGVINWRADWSELTLESGQGVDDAYAETEPNYWLPNFGAGVYYYTNKFYLGLGVPHLIEYDLRDEEINTSLWAKQYRHYYFSTGAAI